MLTTFPTMNDMLEVQVEDESTISGRRGDIDILTKAELAPGGSMSARLSRFLGAPTLLRCTNFAIQDPSVWATDWRAAGKSLLRAFAIPWQASSEWRDCLSP
jgi:hypothetical protein